MPGIDYPNEEAIVHDDSDLIEGAGLIKLVVELDAYSDARRVRNGECQNCGYDRGIYSRHTGISAAGLNCAWCESTLERS